MMGAPAQWGCFRGWALGEETSPFQEGPGGCSVALGLPAALARGAPCRFPAETAGGAPRGRVSLAGKHPHPVFRPCAVP